MKAGAFLYVTGCCRKETVSARATLSTYGSPPFGSALIAGRDYLHGQAVSAYHHVSNGRNYPGVMGVTGVNDPRVPSWIEAKFIARLQAASGSGKPVLLRVDFDGGHGFGSSRTQREEQFADEAAFVLWADGRSRVPAEVRNDGLLCRRMTWRWRKER